MEKRKYSAHCQVGNILYIFGGEINDSIINEFISIDLDQLSNNNLKCTVKIDKNNPKPRMKNAMTYYNKDI